MQTYASQQKQNDKDIQAVLVFHHDLKLVVLMSDGDDCPIWATWRENLFLPYANNKGADQPAHDPRSLISTFIVRCLDSIIPQGYVSEISNFKPLPSTCSWAGRFESTLVANPEDRFSCDEAHIIVCVV